MSGGNSSFINLKTRSEKGIILWVKL
ncbi:hypothetical protein Golax_025920 [Gossypium laxum]|uniref:Uncharacterized protein n=1 Tax=Gossypium laxum TaxID=34288 RepID=A0A7J9B3R4_9ROSI|nr:hypothetical protein [Gossypium laxum]